MPLFATMKFLPSSVALFLASNLVGSGESRGVLAAEDEESNHRRQQAIWMVEGFLSLFQSKNQQEKQQHEVTHVLWNGKSLTPLDQEKKEYVEPHDRRVLSGRIQQDKRRRSRRKTRNTKGAKSSKGSKGEGILDAVFKKYKAVKGGAAPETDIICFSGSYQAVSAACAMQNADCCSGNRACQWTGTATVCPGACQGDDACKIPPGALIGPSSCDGSKACYNAAISSTDSSPLTIGQESCIGNEACQAIGRLGTSVEVQIGDLSCTDQEKGLPCASIASLSAAAKSIEIGNQACQGPDACASIAGSQVEQVELDDGSCRGKESCFGAGAKSTGKTFSIGKNSCYQNLACIGLGRYASDIEIGDESCQLIYSCQGLGFQVYGDISVGDGTCAGEYSCVTLGAYFKVDGGDLTVEDGACSQYAACYRLASFAYNADNVLIKESACSTKENQCIAEDYNECFTVSYLPENAMSCNAR